MKAICLKKHLQEATSLCEKIISNEFNLFLLSGVLIVAKNDYVSFSTTDLETNLKVTISAKIEEEGSVLVPSRLLSNFISSLSINGDIELSSDNANLSFTINNSSTVIRGYDSERFPIPPDLDDKEEHIIMLEDFLAGLKSVHLFAFHSELKPELNSVYVIGSKDKPLVFVATNTLQLSEKQMYYTFTKNFNVLIPCKTVIKILRIFESKKGVLKIKIDENQFALRFKNIEFISRIVDGQYPDYLQIIPKEFENIVTINKKKLIDALNTSILFCSELNDIKVSIRKDFIEIQSIDSNVGKHSIKIDAETDGIELDLILNIKYLNDCLEMLSSNKIVLKFAGEHRPLLVSDFADKSFRYLLMPMRF